MMPGSFHREGRAIVKSVLAVLLVLGMTGVSAADQDFTIQDSNNNPLFDVDGDNGNVRVPEGNLDLEEYNSIEQLDSLSYEVIEVNGAKTETFESGSLQSGDVSGADWGTWTGAANALSTPYEGSQGAELRGGSSITSPNLASTELSRHSTAGRVYLQAWLWTFNDNEHGFVELSTDGGSSFQTVRVLDNDQGTNTRSNWNRISVDITPYLPSQGGSGDIRVRFREGGGGGGDQFRIDNVQLIHAPNRGAFNLGFDNDLFYSGGQVGLGTSSPESQLDVSGNTDLRGNVDLNGNNINNIGGLQNCGNNQFVDGNGNCETDDDKPGNNDFGNADDLDAQGDVTGLSDFTVDDNDVSEDAFQDEYLDENSDDSMSGSLEVNTIDTGNGDYEIGQNLRTTDTVTFDDVTISEDSFDLGQEDLVDIDANSGLGGGGTNGLTDPVDLSVNTGNAITVNNDKVQVADNTIDDEELVNNGIDAGDIGSGAIGNSELDNDEQFRFSDTSSGPMVDLQGGNSGYNGLDISMDDDNSNNDYGLRVRFEDGSIGSRDTGGDVAFTVQPNENSPRIGIDTSNPSNTLDVGGSARFNSLVGDSSGNQCGADQFLNGNGDCTSASDPVEFTNINDAGSDVTIGSVDKVNVDEGAGLRLESPSSNTATLSMSSHWKEIYIDGTEELVPSGQEPLNLATNNELSITADSTANPQKLSFDINAGNVLGNADDLDNQGNINDFSAASDLNQNGDISSFDNANDLDAAGDVSSLSDVNTDSLSEGSSNQYHTDERAQDAVGTILEDGGATTVSYDDGGNSITISSTDNTDDNVNNGELDNLFSGSGILTRTGSGTYTTTTDNVQDGDTSDTNELQDLEDVRSRDNTLSGNIDMSDNVITGLGGGSASINGGDIRLQPESAGGTASISFQSNTNAGSDGGWLAWYDDNNNYNFYGDSGENGALVLGTTNDDQGSTSDVTVLKSPAAAVIDAPSLNLNNNQINNIGGLQNCGSDEFVNGNGDCTADSNTNTQNPINADLVAGDGLSGGSNNVLPGSDSDVTVSLNADDLDSSGNLQADTVGDNEITDNTVDSSEIQNGATFSMDALRSVSDQNAIRFADGDSRITNHDGHGNFNIRTGTDNSNNIVAGTGGTHIRMDENGGVDIEVDESTGTGNTMGEDIGLSINGNSVDIRDGNLDMNNNNINDIGGLQNCGNNQFVDGNGNCETDDDKPGNNDFGNADNLDNSGSLQSNTVADNEIDDNTVDNSEIQNNDQFTFGGITNNGNLDMTDNDHSGDGDITNVNEINLARITSNKGNRIEIVSGQGPLDLNSNEIVGLSDPTDPQDAATRSYVNDNDDVEDDQDLNEVLSDGTDASGKHIDVDAVEVDSDSDYSKLYVYGGQAGANDDSYSIGMHNNMGYGPLNDWATTFTMNNQNDKGWVFRDTAMGTGGGAMALDTAGNMRLNGDLAIEGSIDETADVAEVMEKRDSDAEIEAGDVVAVKQGEVTKNTSGSTLNMVVSAKPGVRLGGQVSQKLSQEEQERLEEKRLDIAFTGRVPTKILGGAESGDYVMPSGGNNGTAVAVPEEEVGFQEYKEAVGVVLERFQVPEHMSKNNTEEYREVLEEAEGESYSIYNVAVGVK